MVKQVQTKTRFQRILRLIMIPVVVGVVGGSVSWYLLNSIITPACAEVYWYGRPAGDGTRFLDRLKGTPVRVLHAAPVNINGKSGYFVAMRSRKTVSEILAELRKRFLFEPDQPVQTGSGRPGGFLIANDGDRTCAMLLIRDHRLKETLMLSVIAPRALFTDTRGELDDVDGIDPIVMLRPPGSQRVFSFQIGSVRYAVYKSRQRTLAAFYEGQFQDLKIRNVSIQAGSNKRLLGDGNLFFFDVGGHGGFAAYQSNPERNESYSIVCAN